ncbi:molybdenum cofactor biosysynthesis protein [Catellatospora sp. TT07R-123]|uniref:MOSC domain-containing protein n=1 Tax=Catellatospora sp. TT07R-123 TaxID=2733863 RepID=UPI001B006923|nr:MOSC domain-containing protein [Catellatospora sp. TT07R-123]GHJ44438.1 molybdenum cofactor biosysynthesis protein [Catellatospora sp. TT07R-123]
MGRIISVNTGRARASEAADMGVTGIDKRSVEHAVALRAPGPRDTGLGSGVEGDEICDRRHHGGDDQAVYAYAREDLDGWAAELGRDVRPGQFGENLTTTGVDVNGALIGERWRVGTALLEVSVPRIPCRTFAAAMAEQGWVKRFTQAALPGAYLRVVEPGEVRAGDEVTVVHRPDHDVSIAVAFRAMTLEPELLPRLVDVEALPASVREKAAARA